MDLLERAVPLETLERIRQESVEVGGRLVLVEGEAGIGKTSLVETFRRRLPATVPSLLGACDPLSTPRPLGPLLDIADELDPAFAERVRTGAPRGEVLDALLAVLRERAGLVLVLDDLHWADEATLDALRFVGRRIASTRSLVIGTYRDDEVGRQHPLRIVVGDLATSLAVRRLPLAPLSPAAVEELARGSGLDAAALHRRTGGNPFYVTEVVAGAPADIPSTVRDAVLARAGRLSDAARRTLEAAAVIGPPTDPALLARVVDGPLAAEECLARGVLATDGRSYAFRHEVARQAILESTDPGAGIQLHARVLAALETGPEDDRVLARLAHHADGAGDRDAVLRYAPAAARQAIAASAHREASAQYERAMRHAVGLPPAERAELLEPYAKELGIVAEVSRGNAAMAEAADIWHALGDTRRESLAACSLARSLVVEGRNPEAELAGRRALDLTAALPDGPEKVEALATQAYLRMLDRDNLEAIELARQAIDLGGDDPAAASMTLAWNTLGSARILVGDLAPGIRDLEVSLSRGLATRDDRGAAGAYSNFVSALGEVYEFAAAEPYYEAGLRFVTERDLDSTVLYLQAWWSLILMHRGRWSEAGTLAASVVARATSSAIGRTMGLLALGRLRARRGDPDSWTALDDALAISIPTKTLQRLAPVHAARAEAAWLAGDLVRTGEEAAATWDLARAHDHAWHVGELAWWLVQSGRPRPDTTGAAEPWRLQLDGHWREASEAWTALECPYEAARALLTSDETSDVQEAHTAFDRLGAGPGQAMAARRLRELGARAIPRGRRPTTRANPAGLTARELEILRFVAAGLPNHEIATRLVLSTRTVDHHVSAILAKLGVDRRAEVEAAATGLGIDLRIGQSGAPD